MVDPPNDPNTQRSLFIQFAERICGQLRIIEQVALCVVVVGRHGVAFIELVSSVEIPLTPALSQREREVHCC